METYIKDASGQWWCQGKRQRTKVAEHTCKQCGNDFPCRHPQQFCSNACRSKASRGNRLGERPCAWCKKPFIPHSKGNRQKCCSKRCAYDLGNTKRGRSGKENGNWKGGVRSHSGGYVRQWVEGRGDVLQHRVVMEKKIGRRLLPKEHVHHKNGIKKDNRPRNLELWVKHHPPGQRVKDLLKFAKWVMDTYGALADKV